MKTKKQNKFLSSTIYNEVVPQDSFWRKANEIIDWSKYSKELSVMYKNDRGGNSNYPPEMLLKMLLLQRMYSTSDRKTQELCTQNIMAKCFLGLEVQQKAPDYSLLSKYRDRILSHFGASFYERFFQEIIIVLQDNGLSLDGAYSVDSSISEADVNTWKDKQRVEKGKEQRDEGASWTAKVRPSKGGKESRTEYYYGYKTHALVNTDKHIITALETSQASKHDVNFASSLVDKGRKVDKIASLSADAAYDDTFLIDKLEDEGILTAFRIRKSRTTQQDEELCMYWEAYKGNPKRKELLRMRGLVERPFADMKNNHGLGRCKYLGPEKYSMQAYLSASAMNLKIGIKSLFGISLCMY